MLPLVCEHLRKQGLQGDERSGARVLETGRIYHYTVSEEEAAYRAALVAAYQAFCKRHSN